MRRLLLTAAAVALISTTALTRASGQDPPAGPTQLVDMVAERFTFTPSEVKTTLGTTLTIRLTSDDTAHGFRLVGTNVRVDIPKRSRGATTVTFTPEAAGRYTFECANVCGAGHSFMRGVIIVDDPSGAAR